MHRGGREPADAEINLEMAHFLGKWRYVMDHSLAGAGAAGR
jgi:hypothetical protein